MTYQFSGKKGFNISRRSLESLCVDSKKEHLKSWSIMRKHRFLGESLFLLASSNFMFVKPYYRYSSKSWPCGSACLTRCLLSHVQHHWGCSWKNMVINCLTRFLLMFWPPHKRNHRGCINYLLLNLPKHFLKIEQTKILGKYRDFCWRLSYSIYRLMRIICL